MPIPGYKGSSQLTRDGFKFLNTNKEGQANEVDGPVTYCMVCDANFYTPFANTFAKCKESNFAGTG